MKMNIWLLFASQFLYRFQLTIRQKSIKKHLMPNTLRRLTSLNLNVSFLDLENTNLDLFLIYTVYVCGIKVETTKKDCIQMQNK